MSDSGTIIDYGPKVATVRFSTVANYNFRLDAKYYQEEFILARARVEGCGFPVIRVNQLASAFVPGRVKLITVTNPGAGAPYLRAHDAFETRPESDRFVASARTPNYSDYLLQEGMILTPSSGRNLGPLAYVGRKLSQFAMTDIIRITPNTPSDGFYLYAYLLTPTGQALIRRGRTGTTVDHLSPKDVLDIPVVWLDDAKRQKIIGKIQSSEERLDRARLHLDALEEELHRRLALPLPVSVNSYSPEEIRTFTVQAGEIAGRLDAAYYDPIVKECVRRLSAIGAEHLASVAELMMLGRYKRYYVGKDFGHPILSGRQLLQLRPVNLQYISEKSFRNPLQFVLEEGWTIFTCDGRAEENLASPAYVSPSWKDWMASNHVMRAIPKNIPPGYLYLALRSPYVQLQLKARATGSVIDALDPQTISTVLIPRLASADELMFSQEADNAWREISEAIVEEDGIVADIEALIVKSYESQTASDTNK